MSIRSEIYIKALIAYEKKQFTLFKEIIETMKTDKEFMFMMFLEAGMEGVQCYKCYDYMIDIFASELTGEQLAVCTIYGLDSLGKIYSKKNIEFGADKQCIYLRNMYKTICPSEYDELEKSLLNNVFDFSGTDEEFELINKWIQIVKKMNDTTQLLVKCFSSNIRN